MWLKCVGGGGGGASIKLGRGFHVAPYSSKGLWAKGVVRVELTGWFGLKLMVSVQLHCTVFLGGEKLLIFFLFMVFLDTFCCVMFCPMLSSEPSSSVRSTIFSFHLLFLWEACC